MTSLNNQKVLVIDDEEPILKMLTQWFFRKGYTVDTAENGAEAIEKATINNYNFILTDINMSEISGEDVFYEIKRIKNNDIPVIGMSGNHDLIDEKLFDAVLKKPFSMKELFEVVDSIGHPSS